MSIEFNKNVKSMEVSGVRKMFELASRMKNPIDLSLGLPDFDVPQNIKDAAIRAINEGKNKYTPTTGIPDLKKKIQEKLKKENKIDSDLDSIIVTSAVSGALSIILAAIINPGDEIALIEPYFVGYKQLVIQNGGKIVSIASKEDFSIDFSDMEKKITKKTKALLINSPNNPTGKVYDKNDMQKIVEICKKNNTLLISDEIYEKFDYLNKFMSPGSIYQNTITANGFSKSYGMTGWRIGYCTGPKDIIQEAIKLQQYNFVCAPTPFQYACIEAFGTDVSEHIKDYKKRSELVYNSLKSKYKIIKPEGAFYAYVKYPYEADKFMAECLKHELLIVPGSAFSDKNTHFRLSFAANPEILKRGLDILNKIA